MYLELLHYIRLRHIILWLESMYGGGRGGGGGGRSTRKHVMQCQWWQVIQWSKLIEFNKVKNAPRVIQAIDGNLSSNIQQQLK